MYVTHPFNFLVGWGMVLSAFVTGAAIGLFFHREEFLGGYTSFWRRILRLGHIALAALGMMNVLFSLCPVARPGFSHAASIAFIVGGLSMPAVCFLTGWKQQFRHLFFIPVIALASAVVLVLIGGVP